jgi:NDP-sugar pyrophosphorylase family protein
MDALKLGYYVSETPSVLGLTDFSVLEALDELPKILPIQALGQESFANDRQKIVKSVVEPGAYLGDFCLIRNSFVCVGARIGAFCEVSNSLILNDALIPHHNFVANSIIGVGVRLGGNTRTAVRRLDKKAPKVRIGNHLYSALSDKVGAIVGDGTRIGSSVVLNPLTLLGKHCVIYPQQSIWGFFPERSEVRK